MSKLESETEDTEKKMRGSLELLLSAGKGHRRPVKQVRAHQRGHCLRAQITKDKDRALKIPRVKLFEVSLLGSRGLGM